MNLSEMTNRGLAEHHNVLAHTLGRDKIKVPWKGKKSALVERVTAMQTELDHEQSAGKTGRTIRAAALEHLCHVSHHENRAEKSGPDNVVGPDSPGARSVGLPYDEIIRRLVAEFPLCKTTPECLRWYAVKVRVEEHGYEGLRLPQRRPRVKPRK